MYIYFHVHSGFKQCTAKKEALSVTVYLSCSMPLVFQDRVSRDDRFMIVVKEHAPFRYMVIFIQGVCSLAECRSFVSKCSPVGTDLPPSAQDHFQHHDLVNVSTHGFQTPSGNRVDILHYFGEVFAQRGEFTDAYTFHVCKHCIKTMPEHCVPTFTVNYVKRADVL